ncbi:zinc metalloproteinase nas-7-like [Agrilus planipennis]|uniref:Metalloendopeptidase n=1 Tax=Agrilus planipennis TaxID=224129 RepID=A0A1W4XMJ4_AGRPL|nr:zinc metalloproteinase nas-7-like [Agrilus planipennis]
MSLRYFFILIVARYSSVFCFPTSETEPDYSSGNDLSYLGSSVFGKPSEKTGEKVENWDAKTGINPEELGEYAEGDILFPDTKTKNGLMAATYRWPDGVIPFEIRGSFTKQERQFIISAMNMYHKYTCIRFRYRNSSDIDYISIDNGRSGCWSSVGRVGGRQTVNLQSPGCLIKIGTVIHELLHAVGFQHEQNRWERDSYVDIKWNNIEESRWNNFVKMDKQLAFGYGIPYDYNSVMHYSRKAFSKNGLDTIIPLVKGSNIGQREGFSKSDIEKVKTMYTCKKIDRTDGGELLIDETNEVDNSGGPLGALSSIVSWFLPQDRTTTETTTKNA